MTLLDEIASSLVVRLSNRFDSDRVDFNRRFDRLEARSDRLEKGLQSIKEGLVTIMATLADVQARVAAEHDVNQSAITLLQNLSQMLKDALASNDPNAIQAIIDQMDSENKSLADAVTANTPAAPNP